MESGGVHMGVWLVCAHASPVDRATYPIWMLGKDVGNIRATNDGMEGLYCAVGDS